MIENLYIHECNVSRKITSTAGATESSDRRNVAGARSADNYDTFAINQPCLFRTGSGKTVEDATSGRAITEDATLKISLAVLEDDRIEFEGFNYRVANVLPEDNPITEVTEYFSLTLSKEGQALPKTVVVKNQG